MAIRRNRCTSSGTVRKSSSRVKASRSQAQGRTLRLFGTDLMRHAIIRLHSPRVIYCLILYRLYLLCFVHCEWLQAEFLTLSLFCNSYVSTRLFERLINDLINLINYLIKIIRERITRLVEERIRSLKINLTDR